MGSKLSESLSQFISSQNDFSNPYDDEIIAPKRVKESSDEHKGKKKKKKKKTPDSKLNSLYEKVKGLSDDDDNYEIIEDFEAYLQDYFLDDEDAELKRSLIKHGRKYTRDTRISGEASEIQKAYASSEEELEKLLVDVNGDKEAIQKDLAQMRANRSRNYKTMSEMMEQRTSLHNTVLGIIKEKNKMVKDQFDLQMKVDKGSSDDSDIELSANRAIQNLFSMGRENLLESYSSISGADEAGYIDNEFDEDEMIDKKYFSDDEETSESDGDKFIKYEGMGIHYILEYDDDGPVQIVPEDMDGNPVPDYPTPDINELQFTLSENTQTATDNLTQQYKLRKI